MPGQLTFGTLNNLNKVCIPNSLMGIYNQIYFGLKEHSLLILISLPVV